MKFVAAIEWLSDWSARLAAVLLALMTGLILLEILLWNAFEMTTLIADEYSAYGLAAIVFLGAGYCLRTSGHIRITLILGLFSPRVGRWMTFLGTCITGLFMGYVCYQLFIMTNAAHQWGSTSGTLTQTPIWIPQALMLAGAVIFLLQFLGSAVRAYQAIETGEEVF